MKLYTQIKGEEITSNDIIKDKAFSIGSQFLWGDNVWEILKAKDGCNGCYFYGNGKCYRQTTWIEILGACSGLVRADENDVIFQFHKQK